MKTALAIAGFDPSGWAGVLADIKTFEAFGVQGVAAISALTAQNRKDVMATQSVKAAFMKKEVNALTDGFRIDAVKIGMLGSAANVRAVAEIIKNKKFKNIVLDTVFCSTSGHALLDKKGIVEIKRLLPLVTLATPNIAEASVLSGIKIKNIKDMEDAALAINALGAKNVLVKGGHLPGEPIDILFDGRRIFHFKGKRIKAKKEVLHGTGCLLSSGIAACLAKGLGVRRAVKDARGYLMKELKKRG
ncbi:MAG: bifunctional hydroxymethylpyrimidine kinase/phosphomethylpyrimidine kinase [Deltaproteobacteria bacterium]|nr:bifunctional hydroxymethylpyrimidine kinase/phosphomethylpyrimidine kinase [Deltaproteobacteria bacterium]